MTVPEEREKEKITHEEIDEALKDFFTTTLETIQEETSEGSLKDTTLEAILVDFDIALEKIPLDQLESFASRIRTGIEDLYVERVKEVLQNHLAEKLLEVKDNKMFHLLWQTQ